MDLKNTLRKRLSGEFMLTTSLWELLSRIWVARLSSILEKRTLLPEKLDEIKIKLNVLSAFQKQAESEKVGRLAEEL